MWNHWICFKETTGQFPDTNWSKQHFMTRHNVFLTLTKGALYLNLTKPWAQRRQDTKLKCLSFSVWNAIFSDLCLFYLHNLVQLICMIFRLLVTTKIFTYSLKDSGNATFSTVAILYFISTQWRIVVSVVVVGKQVAKPGWHHTIFLRGLLDNCRQCFNVKFGYL